MDPVAMHALVEACLTWIGFGVVCGAAAKAIMPGRDPGGTGVTLFLGVGGALLGSATYGWFSGDHIRDLISVTGFFVATLGAIILLITHRVLSGRLFRPDRHYVEEVIVPAPNYTTRRRRTVRADD